MDLLLEGHELYKNNPLIHKKKASDKRKKNAKTRRPTKLK